MESDDLKDKRKLILAIQQDASLSPSDKAKRIQLVMANKLQQLLQLQQQQPSSQPSSSSNNNNNTSISIPTVELDMRITYSVCIYLTVLFYIDLCIG